MRSFWRGFLETAALLLFIAIAFYCLLCIMESRKALSAEPPQNIIINGQNAVKANPADIRFKGWDNRNGSYHGSATVVGTGKQGSWILTCNHNITSTTGMMLIAHDGSQYGCKVMGRNTEADLCLLWSSDMKEWPSYRGISTEYSEADLYVVGYPGVGTRHNVFPTQSTGKSYGFSPKNMTPDIMEVKGGVAQGQSGGSILNTDGNLVAVVFGSDGTTTMGVGGQTLVNFVSNIVTKHYREVQYSSCQGGGCSSGAYYILPQGSQGYAPSYSRPSQKYPETSIKAPPSQNNNKGVAQEKKPVNNCDCKENWETSNKNFLNIKAEIAQLQATLDEIKEHSHDVEFPDPYVPDYDKLTEEVQKRLDPIHFIFEGREDTDPETIHLGETLTFGPIRVLRRYDGVVVGDKTIPMSGGGFVIEDLSPEKLEELKRGTENP